MSAVMTWEHFVRPAALLLAALLAPPPAGAAEALYREHCAGCHGADRYGGMGPALLPESLARLSREAAADMIRASRPAVQMPAFGGVLDAGQIEALVEYLYTPVEPPPRWSEEQVRASRLEYHAAGSLPDRPVFTADPMNLFIVVEAGDHHVSVVDGDAMEPIHRFASRYALHGGPKFTPDGRYVFFASRDGWVTKFDLWNLTVVAEVRAGLNTRNLAVSGDGRWVAVANYLPPSLVVLDAELGLVAVHATGDAGRGASRVSAVYDAGPRGSFVAAMKDVDELWELDYGVGGAGEVPAGLLGPRRIPLEAALDDFFFTDDYAAVMGSGRGADGRGAGSRVVELSSGRTLATLTLPGMPHLGSGISWTWQGRRVMATPNLRSAVVDVIDMQDWRTLREIPTAGPGFFMRSHENTPYAWVDAMLSEERGDTLTVIDKQTLEVVAELRPEPGRRLAHVEFTRDGAYALASLSEDDGALIVYDATTLEEVKRIPARKPVGKYNVGNKLSRSEGTSH